MGFNCCAILLTVSIYSFFGDVEASGTFAPIDCSDFLQLAKSSAYVDKSSLLKYLFQGSKMYLITAPRGFGKSVNLDMIRTFFTIPINNQEVVNSNQSEAHKIFTNLKIFKDKKYFYTHFATYPVLFLDLKVDIKINSYVDILTFLMNKIRASFRVHNYLLSSINLDKELITLCTQWCEEKADQISKESDILNGLVVLAKCLKCHYSKKIYVLVDDYDSIITSTFLNNPSVDLSSTVGVVLGRLSNLCNASEVVEGCLLTGRSNVLDASYDGLLFKSYQFLRSHDVAPFYGFTKKEVSRLLTKFAVVKSKAKGVKRWYNGYRTMDDENIYNPVSIMNFLSGSHSIRRYWANYDSLKNQKLLFSRLPIQTQLEALLASKTVSINVIDKFDWYHLLTLRDMYCCRNATIDIDVLFTYFIENGYLMPTTLEESGESTVKIPNLEIEYFFLEEIQKSYDRFNVSLSMEGKSI